MVVGGWFRRKASLSFFPFLFPGSLLRVSSRSRLSPTTSRTNNTFTISTPLSTAAALREKYLHTSALAPSFAARDMFGRGEQYRVQAAPPPPLRQSQSSLSSAFRPPTNKYSAAPTNGTMKLTHGPSLNTTLGKNVSSAPPPRTNPPQTLKPRDNVVRAFDNSSSFVDSGCSVSSSVAFEAKHQSQMSALHDAVFFDEADFEDDEDLNFDDSIVHELPSHSFDSSPNSFRAPSQSPSRVSPPLYKSGRALREPTPPTKRAYASINDKHPAKNNTRSQLPNSSAPLPWSSSPVEHLGLPLRPTSRVPVEVVNLIDETEPEAPKKKRKVPWQTEAVAPSRAALHPKIAPPNRASKDLKIHQYPWDMTASDLKKASRKEKRSLSTATEGATKKSKGLKQKKLMLSDEQMHVLDLVLESKKSVFFTGSAGTGKSVLMREAIASLRNKHSSGSVAVTASTGLAACNVGGVTLHSFAGIGLGKESVPDLVRKIKRNAKAKGRWLNTKVLVIDEISMVDGELFDKLELIARTMRNNGRPFGGIQLVITGDFFQLPPVPDYGKVAKFAFDADSWNTTIEHTIGLTQVFRQKNPEFAAILNEMRLGKLSPRSIATFRGLSRPLTYTDGIEATELFPTRQEVDAANSSKMRVLTGNAEAYIAEDTGTIADKTHRDKLLSNCMAPISIDLKINSQVMLIKNIDDTLVNGSLGRIVGFMDEQSFDRAYMEEEEAPSRAPKSDLKSTAKLWPLVEFALPDGSSRQLLVQREQWKVELPSGEVQACRSQIPLILAWALSIHKAQGQTLERVKVDLGKVFEKGQAYVALSRATCQEGLQVLRFDASKVMAHEKVRAFYASLYSAAEAKVEMEGRGGNRQDEYQEPMQARRAG